MSDIAQRAWEKAVDELHREVERLKTELVRTRRYILHLGGSAYACPECESHHTVVYDDGLKYSRCHGCGKTFVNTKAEPIPLEEFAS